MWTYSRNTLSMFIARLMAGGDDDPILGRIHFHVGGTVQTLAPVALTAEVEGLAVQDVLTRVQQSLDRVLERIPVHQTVVIVRVLPMARTTDADDRPTYVAWTARPQHLELTCERVPEWQPETFTASQALEDPEGGDVVEGGDEYDEEGEGDDAEGGDGDEDGEGGDPDAEDEPADPGDEGTDTREDFHPSGFGLDDATYERHTRPPAPTEPQRGVHTRPASLDLVQPRTRQNQPPRGAAPRSRSTAMAQPDRRPHEAQVRVVHVPTPAPASNEFERQAAALVLEIARQSVAQALAGATKREESHETQMAGLLSNLDRLTGQNAELTRAQYDRERSAYDAAERRREAELRELRRQMAEAQAEAAEREQQLVSTLTATTSQLAEARATAAAADERAKRKIAEAASEEDKMTETIVGMVGPRLMDKFLPVTPPTPAAPPAQAPAPKQAPAPAPAPQRRQPVVRREPVYVDDDDSEVAPTGPRRPQAIPVHAPPAAAAPASTSDPSDSPDGEAGGLSGMLGQLRTLADLPKPIRKALMRQVKEQIGEDMFKALRETLDEDSSE